MAYNHIKLNNESKRTPKLFTHIIIQVETKIGNKNTPTRASFQNIHTREKFVRYTSARTHTHTGHEKDSPDAHTQIVKKT